MPMPEELTIANVNEAISNATILTDNAVSINRYQSELKDCGRDVRLMPSGNENAPIPLKENIMGQDKIIKEIMLRRC